MEEVLWNVSENKYVPVSIDLSKLPVYNAKYTSREIVVYNRLGIKKYRNEERNIEKRYLVAGRKRIYDEHFVANEGAIVLVEYSSGSFKYTYYYFRAFFRVAPVGRKTYRLTNRGDVNETLHGELDTTNLVLLTERIDGARLTELEAYIINTLGVYPSKYDPVLELYELIGETESEIQLLEKEIRELEKLLKEKKKRLKELRKRRSRAYALAENL